MKRPNQLDNRYESIIDLPHHTSSTRPRMSMHDRAAQFSPFAALVGYDGAINETARLTHAHINLSDDEIAKIDSELASIAKNLQKKPANTVNLTVSLTYFEPDPLKDGGTYISVSTGVKKIDTLEDILILADGTKIPFANITALQLQPRSDS